MKESNEENENSEEKEEINLEIEKDSKDFKHSSINIQNVDTKGPDVYNLKKATK